MRVLLKVTLLLATFCFAVGKLVQSVSLSEYKKTPSLIDYPSEMKLIHSFILSLSLSLSLSLCMSVCMHVHVCVYVRVSEY